MVASWAVISRGAFSVLAKSTIWTWPVLRPGKASNDLLLFGHKTHNPSGLALVSKTCNCCGCVVNVYTLMMPSERSCNKQNHQIDWRKTHQSCRFTYLRQPQCDPVASEPFWLVHWIPAKWLAPSSNHPKWSLCSADIAAVYRHRPAPGNCIEIAFPHVRVHDVCQHCRKFDFLSLSMDPNWIHEIRWLWRKQNILEDKSPQTDCITTTKRGNCDAV